LSKCEPKPQATGTRQRSPHVTVLSLCFVRLRGRF
jgi:hypothetical protein